MRKFIKGYTNPNEERMNFGLINREQDKDLIEHIAASCKSLEVLDYIKFQGHSYIDNEQDIDLNDYIVTRKKPKKTDTDKYMYMEENRYGELRLSFKISCKGEEKEIVKKLLIPVADEQGYYTIKGKKYFLMYQLVDASTYRSKQNLILKSLMPVSIMRELKEDVLDTTGVSHGAPIYKIYNFSKAMNIFLFYFANFGVNHTLTYFGVNKVIRFVNSNEEDLDNNIYFPINKKISLEVNKNFFHKYSYVKSMAFTLLDIVSNRLTFEMLEDKVYWVERIGSLKAGNSYNYYKKGLSILISFNRMMDETTKQILKLHAPNKSDIFSIVRWLMQNYTELRKKDNLDLTNKRLRCNEYIASLLTMQFSQRLNRIILAGPDIDISKVEEIFSFPGDIIMQQLYKSGLLRFDDRINDMDFFSKLKYTIKGPNSLGRKNSNNIPMVYRGTHPSYIGRIDINVCGSSDPGSSGIITPFAKTNELFFDDSFEPEDGIRDMEKDIMQYHKNSNPDKLHISVYSKNGTAEDDFKRKEMFINDINRSEITRRIYQKAAPLEDLKDKEIGGDTK